MLQPLSKAELEELDQYWRACNYLAAGMIYLCDNPLIEEPLKLEHFKQRLLGHWGSAPGLSFIYCHLNRAIVKHNLEMIFITGPGHGAPGVIAPVYLEGAYTEIYPQFSQDKAGICNLFKKFSFPGGLGSHCTPELPGSIHEGGELGYSLAHAYGAVFDHPDLIAAVVVGDGEAETGPLATAWHSNKFLNPKTDGAVLPILHLNGYKINNPSLLARITPEELNALFCGYGYTPILVEGSEPHLMHQRMAAAIEESISLIREIQKRARHNHHHQREAWPLIILRSPKGWTGPKHFNGQPIENFWRSHQVPITIEKTNPLPAINAISDWLLSYRPHELFTPDGQLKLDLSQLVPSGQQRMSMHPVTNGGYPMSQQLDLPDYRTFGIQNLIPGVTRAGNTTPLGQYLAAIMQQNPHNFRLFGPDETTSNKLDAVYQVTQKCFWGEILPIDQAGKSYLAHDGRVMEMLSEHTLEGWLEGYTLSGRYGLLATYEAFAHVIDSMLNQHCKWLTMLNREHWRKKVPSLNLLLTSTVWRQDHNGFTHQDPGFVDVITNKKSDVTRIYFPPDANTLLSTAEHCFKSKNYVNVIVIDKQQHLQFVPIAEATQHCAAGISIWQWASDEAEPDVVIASCGDIVTAEALAARQLLRELAPRVNIRFVNVIDLFRLASPEQHQHGLTATEFNQLFTHDKPVIFNFHGYPSLINSLIAKRSNNLNFKVHGYQEQGSINTPLELAISNQVDRFSLAIDALNQLPSASDYQAVINQLQARRQYCQEYAHEHGIDPEPEASWSYQ